MVRKLLFEDKRLQNDIVSLGLSGLENTAKVLRDKYKTLGMGDLDNETYQSIVQGGYDYIVKKMVKAVDDDLAKANLSLPSIRQSIRQGALADVNRRLAESKIKFPADIVHEGKEYKPSFTNEIRLTGDLLTLQDGRFTVNEEKKQHLFDEYTRIYIENEDDQRLWDNLDEFGGKINAQNEFFRQIGVDLIKPFTGTYYAPPGTGQAFTIPPDTLSNLFNVDSDGVFSVKPTAIRYVRRFAEAKLMKERLEKREKGLAAKISASPGQKKEEPYGGEAGKQNVVIDDAFVDDIIT